MITHNLVFSSFFWSNVNFLKASTTHKKFSKAINLLNYNSTIAFISLMKHYDQLWQIKMEDLRCSLLQDQGKDQASTGSKQGQFVE